MNKVCLLFVIFLFSTSSYGWQTEGIEVSGKSSIMVMPDQFALTLHIKERGKSAEKTKLLVDAKSNKLISMFEKEGINSLSIESSQLRMFPIYEKPSIQLEPLDVRKSAQMKSDSNIRFEIGRTITVKLDKLEIYDRVVDKAVKLGVSNISPLQMSISNPDEHYEKALVQAIEHAHLKAKKVAQQAGVKLGKLSSLKESSYHSPTRYRMAAESSTGFASQVTSKAVSAQVIVIYDIQH